jgi:hypothetical protein
MSIMNKFSMTYNMNRANKREDILDSTAKMNLYNEKGKEYLSEDVVKHLMNFGYDLDQIMTAFKIYKFTTVDEAIHIIMRDPETGKYPHRFIPGCQKNDQGYERVKSINTCIICSEGINDHIDYELDQLNSRDIKLEMGAHKKNEVDEAKDTTVVNDKSNNMLKTSLNQSGGVIETKIHSDRKILNIQHVEIPKETLDLFEDPEICRICFSEVLNEKNKIQFACGHSFCRNCILNHLTININNGKVIDLYELFQS